MTATQLNAMYVKLWQNIGAIADNETLMRRLAKYVAKLAKEQEDATLKSKEKPFAKIERAKQQ